MPKSKTRREQPSDALRFAPEVTRRHATIFMQALFYDANTSGALYDAFDLTGVIQWPSEDENWITPAQMRYESIESEILRRTVAEVEMSIEAAFLRVAREVIERERAKDRKSSENARRNQR